MDTCEIGDACLDYSLEHKKHWGEGRVYVSTWVTYKDVEGTGEGFTKIVM